MTTVSHHRWVLLLAPILMTTSACTGDEELEVDVSDDDSSAADDDGDDDDSGADAPTGMDDSGEAMDSDGDGWTFDDGDCDDLDALIHPGADDACFDGVDGNCDGAAIPCSSSLAGADLVIVGDEGCAWDEHDWYYCAGGDDFGHLVTVSDDLSGDGEADLVVGSWGADVIQVFTQIEPGAYEHARDADVTIEGLGYSGRVDAQGDFNGDGALDLATCVLVGTAQEPQEAALFYDGPLSNGTMNSDAAAARIDGELYRDLCSAFQAHSDLDDDGFDDVVLGRTEYYGTSVIAFPGPIIGVLTPELAGAWIEEDETKGLNGDTLSSDGDHDGDGVSDLVLAASYPVGETAYPGEVFVFAGGPWLTDGEFHHTDAQATITGVALDDIFGRWVLNAGDVNGDGLDDLLVVAIRPEPTVHLFAAPFWGVLSVVEAEATFAGPSVYSNKLVRVGDVNADGFEDVLMGDGVEDDSRGVAYLLPGPLAGEVQVEDVGGVLVGENAAIQVDLSWYGGDSAGSSIAGGADFNGDGYDDLVIGAPGYSDDDNPSRHWGAGAAYVVFGGP